MAEKAQVGDLIRITKDSFDDETHIGEIFEVTEIDGSFVNVNSTWNDGSEMNYLEGEYVIHRKAGEEEEKPKHYCDICSDELGKICCTSSHGGEFCSAKCADAYESAQERLEQLETQSNAVDHPSHYTQGRYEVIDIIEDAVEGADPFEAVCQANVLKYMLRYRHKNGVQDVEKAIWYANKLAEHIKAR